MRKGTLFTLSAPSGAGKTTLVAALLKSMSNVQVSVSHTTRDARPGEVDGVNYHFVHREQFQQMIAESDFLEHAEVHGNYYGTSRHWVAQTLASGVDVILEIDWQGAAQIRKLYPNCLGIFILPPSIAALRQRLDNRGQDDAEVIDRRVAAAQAEMNHYDDADYLIINDDFDIALRELQSVITARRCHISIQSESQKQLLRDLLS